MKLKAKFDFIGGEYKVTIKIKDIKKKLFKNNLKYLEKQVNKNIKIPNILDFKENESLINNYFYIEFYFSDFNNLSELMKDVTLILRNEYNKLLEKEANIDLIKNKAY